MTIPDGTFGKDWVSPPAAHFLCGMHACMRCGTLQAPEGPLAFALSGFVWGDWGIQRGEGWKEGI